MEERTLMERSSRVQLTEGRRLQRTTQRQHFLSIAENKVILFKKISLRIETDLRVKTPLRMKEFHNIFRRFVY